MKPEDWISVTQKELPDDIPCLILGKSGNFQVVQKTPMTWYDIEAWMPIVPPHKPDPFEVWWWHKVNTSAWGNDVKEVCRRAWDAALKSKEQGE